MGKISYDDILSKGPMSTTHQTSLNPLDYHVWATTRTLNTANSCSRKIN